MVGRAQWPSMAKPMPSLSSPLAAIDMGSNSFRLEIGRLQRGQYRRIDYLKDMVRLGGGLDELGRLTEPAVERGLSCLRRFASRLKGFAPGQVRAVATQTLREAKNRNAFLARAQDALGYPIEVISGREEARLIYSGVAHLQPTDEPRLVVDIGGRSTEMILGQGATPGRAESFQVGCVSLSMRFFPDGAVTQAGFRQAQIAAGAELEEGLKPFARANWQRALGSSGTISAVSQWLAAAGQTDGRITAEGLRWCITQCLKAGHVEALDFPGVKVERRAVLPGGLAILYTLATSFEVDALHPAKGALRQGVIIDLHERLEALQLARPGDMRDRSVSELQRRFGVDRTQAGHVRSVALALFDSARPGADTDDRRELGWACDLHEIGLMVSHHDHHRHSAYLIDHVDAPGFSQSQQRRVGELVLGQRGGLRKIETLLSSGSFAWQVLCLRLAVIKCHARGAVDHRVLSLKADRDQAHLGYDAAWAVDRLRTVYLLREEAAAWARHGPLTLHLPAE